MNKTPPGVPISVRIDNAAHAAKGRLGALARAQVWHIEGDAVTNAQMAERLGIDRRRIANVREKCIADGVPLTWNNLKDRAK